jgi:diguanylate cyclase (GGDEF)-like protein
LGVKPIVRATDSPDSHPAAKGGRLVVKRAGAPASRGGAAAFRGDRYGDGAFPHGLPPAGVVQLDPERRRPPTPAPVAGEDAHRLGEEAHRLGEARLGEARLEVLFELSQLDVHSVTELLDALLDGIVRLTASKYGYIFFYDEATELFTLHAWSKGVMPDCAIKDPQSVYALAGMGLWGEVVRQRRSIVVNDFIAPNPLKKGLPPGHTRLIRFMSVPVFKRDAIVAVAGVANKSIDYTDADLAQLGQVMDGSWRIVERQAAEDELRRLARELERRAEDRTRELEAANRELEAVNQELAAANATLHGILGEQESLQAELAYRALHDPLTGLANRTMFQERLDYAFRTSQRGVAVLWIDLDRFKEVNDIFGHDVGDEMLVAVADRLRDVLRESDDIARLGGDEFAVVLPNVVESEAQMIGERILRALVNRDAFRLQVGASLGVAWQSPGERDRSSLMRRADEAMYRAKAMGGGQTVLS